MGNEKSPKRIDREKTPIIPVKLNEDFFPFALPERYYNGFFQGKPYKLSKIRFVELDIPNLAPLEFDIITIPSKKDPSKIAVCIQSRIDQAVRLGLLNEREPESPYCLYPPYEFNQETLEVVKNLRFTFITPEGGKESPPTPEDLEKGRIRFTFTADKSELTKDLKAIFRLAENTDKKVA